MHACVGKLVNTVPFGHDVCPNPEASVESEASILAEDEKRSGLFTVG